MTAWGVKKISAFAFAFAISMGVPITVEASLMQLTNLFVFGDSLSDGGNSGLRTQQYTGNPSIVFPPPPYYNGQYSNGPVAVQYLWNLYNPANPGGFTPSLALAGGTNYAIGGATTGLQNYNAVSPSVPDSLRPAFAQYGNAWELQQFAATHPAFNPATSLFVVWLFPNDVFYATATGTLRGQAVPGSSGGADLVSNGIANIVTTIETLAAAGATHFLVPNMPDLGLTPEFRNTPSASVVSTITAAFDMNLATTLTALDQLLLSAEIVQFNTNQAFADILANPGAFGFTNTTDACVANLVTGVCNPQNWDTWMFWDGVHPTTRTAQILAGEFRAAVPEPTTIVLFSLGMFAMAALHKRKSL